MKNFNIFVDSTSNLDTTYAKNNDIIIVSAYVSLDGNSSVKEIEMQDKEVFFNNLKNNKDFYPTTSLPSVQDFIDEFTPYLEKSEDILCICLSSKISGTFQSALNARNILLENYPDRNIVIIDSMLTITPQAQMAKYANMLRENGFSILEIEKILNIIKVKAKVNFVVEDLNHFKKGGRLNNIEAFSASLLNIKVIVRLSEGVLGLSKKVRGSKKAILNAINIFKEDTSKENNEYIVEPIYVSNPESLNPLLEQLDKQNVNYNKEFSRVSITISCHTGAKCYGFSYFPKYSVEDFKNMLK